MRDENHGIIGASSPRQLTHTLPAQHQHAPYAWLPALVVVLALAAVVAGAAVAGENSGSFDGLLAFFRNLGAEISQNLVTLKDLIVETITAKKIQTEKLCLDDVCVESACQAFICSYKNDQIFLFGCIRVCS